MIPIRFRQGQLVYFIENNIIVEGIIYSGYILFNSDEDNQYKTYYYIKVNDVMIDNPYKDELLFKTREELAQKA